jgi:hypothetical protein
MIQLNFNADTTEMAHIMFTRNTRRNLCCKSRIRGKFLVLKLQELIISGTFSLTLVPIPNHLYIPEAFNIFLSKAKISWICHIYVHMFCDHDFTGTPIDVQKRISVHVQLMQILLTKAKNGF